MGSLPLAPPPPEHTLPRLWKNQSGRTQRPLVSRPLLLKCKNANSASRPQGWPGGGGFARCYLGARRGGRGWESGDQHRQTDGRVWAWLQGAKPFLRTCARDPDPCPLPSEPGESLQNLSPGKLNLRPRRAKAGVGWEPGLGARSCGPFWRRKPTLPFRAKPVKAIAGLRGAPGSRSFPVA